MASCHDMKQGEVYFCKDCGMELKVVKECKHSETPADDCCCHDDGTECAISCCGKSLEKKIP